MTMADADSGGGGARRPASRPGRGSLRPGLQRNVATRSITSRDSVGSGGAAGQGAGNAERTMPPRRCMTREQSVAIRNRVKTELQGMQRQLQQTSAVGESSHREQPREARESAKREAKESAQLISNLQQANNENEETIKHLKKQLSEMQSQKISAEAEAFDWKRKHSKLKVINFELLQKMATKAQQQIKSHSETTKAEVEDWKERYGQMGRLYDMLVEKVGDLSDENGELVAKCQQFEINEKKHREELAQLDDIQEECETLHQSMEEAMQMATRMNESMAKMVRDHKSTIGDYEEQLADLNGELIRAMIAQKQSDEKLDEANSKLVKAAFAQKQSESKLDALRKENELLRTQFAEADEYYRKNLAKLKGEKKGQGERAGI